MYLSLLRLSSFAFLAMYNDQENAFFAEEIAAEIAAQAYTQSIAQSNAQSNAQTVSALLVKAAIPAVIAGVAYLVTRPRVKRAVAELFKS